MGGYGQPQINYAGIVNQNGGYRYGSPASNQQNIKGNKMAGNQPDWGGMSRFADQQQRMNTPFHVQQVKDAFGAHANALSGLGSQIGSQLNANADRASQAKQQAVGWAANQNVLPFEFTDTRQGVNQAYGGVKQGAPDQFGSWLKMNEQYQNHRADLARQNQIKDQMAAYSPEVQQAQRDAYIQNQRDQMEMERQRGYAQLPLQQERMKMMQGLFGNLFSGLGGMFGGGGAPAPGGSVPNGFTTNFGASGRIV